jgi:F-type H+-transporting ATPase subunit gamma
MANRRVLLKRRKAVRNTRKITRTMQLIATARFQAAMNRATASRPYTEKLGELVADLSGVAEDVRHPLLQTPEEVKKSVLLIITSNRGLCGGYNAHVLRTALDHLDEAKTHNQDTEVHMIGRKGIAYFKFLKRALAAQRTDIGDTPRFEDVEPIAGELINRFQDGDIGSVHVAYTRFFSMGRQRPEVMQLLPLAQEAVEDTDRDGRRTGPDYEFSPDPAGLLDELLPATVRVRLFQCFTDAAVSEQIARMVAMKAATDAAGDMITTLTRQYNRARQTQITMELLDIVGGANALA